LAVVVYTTPSCPHCRSAKRFLSERHIPFQEVDVTKSERSVQELKRKSGQTGVPVIDVNGKIIVGFNTTKLIQALGLRG
jgi:glutaredoxin 3